VGYHPRVLRSGLALVLGLAAACDCQTNARQLPYGCKVTTDCADEYACVNGTCVSTSLGGGAAQGGGSANGGGAAEGGGVADGGGVANGGGVASGGGVVNGGGLEAAGGGSMGGGTGMGGGASSDGGAVALAFTGAPQTVIRGACSAPIHVEVVDALQQPTRVGAPIQVQLGGIAPGPVAYYSDPACTVQVSQLMLTPAEDFVQFSFRPDTQGSITITGTSFALMPASQDETVLPIVRRGSCTLDVGLAAVSCPISPPQTDLAHTALFFQTAGQAASAGDSEVRCSFSDVATVKCNRVAMGSVVDVTWQTLEPAAGLSVQHVPFMCSGATVLNQAISPVNPSDTFVMKSSNQDGANIDANDLVTSMLTDAGTVTLQLVAACGVGGPMQGALEVVEVTGASVTRGTHAPLTGLTEMDGGLSAVDLSSTMVLASERAFGGYICSDLVRVSLSGPTGLLFSRGDNAPACGMYPVDAVAWERVDFATRAKVHSTGVWMDAGVLSVSLVPGSGFDPPRAVVLATSQGMSGSGNGEASSSVGIVLGEGNATFTVDGGTVVITRGSALGSARFTVQFVQWNP
jgi:hypothetical protein